jgi:hypothetical protein
MEYTRAHGIKSWEQLQEIIPAKPVMTQWVNVGGQLILRTAIDKLIKQVHAGRVKSWNDIHAFYQQQAESYGQEKLLHAFAALKEVQGIQGKKMTPVIMKELLEQSIATKEWMAKGIYESRAKDYRNPFRKMVYESQEAMDKVVGKLADNTFIKQEQAGLESYRRSVKLLINRWKLQRVY